MKIKKIKRLASVLVVLVVAVLVAGYAVLATMDFENLRGVIEAEARKATGRDLVLAGPIDLAVSFSPAIALEDVQLANADWGSRPEMVTFDRLEVEVALLPLLSGEIAVRRLILVKPDILLETDPQGRGNWVPTASTGEPGEATGAGGTAALPSFDAVEIRDGRVTYRDGRSGQELRFELDELTLQAADRRSPVRLDLVGRYNDAPVALSGQLGAFADLIADRAYSLDLHLEAGGATATLAGTIAQPLRGQALDVTVTARGQSLAELGAITGTPPPPLGPYSLSATIARETETSLRVSGLALKIGDSDLAGNATLSLGEMGGRVEAALTSDLLALGDFTGGDGADAPAQAGSPYVFPETPLPLDLLWMADAKLKLTVGELRLREGVTLTDLDLALAVDQGKLAVRPFNAVFSGGALQGALTLDGGPAASPLTLELTARDLDYGRLLADLEISDGVSGTLDANVSLAGAGDSPRALGAGLDGRIEIVGGAGLFKNKLLRSSATGLFGMLSRWTEGGTDMKLNCAVARLPITGGLVKAEPILLDTTSVTVGGGGEIDLRDESLALTLTPQAKDASMMALAVPFRVGGTLKAPKVAPYPVGTAVGAAKIAGLFLNPLTAGAVLVLDQKAGGGNPCVAALEGASQAPTGPAGAATGTVGHAAEGAGQVLKGIGEGVGGGLKSLFGN